MADRIEELRRRVRLDPASIAFAALAEEYRRAGRPEEAIATCKVGLRRHPAYVSARVTLGRALIDLGRYGEAREELEQVIKMAPENLAAIRGLAEIHQRLGHREAGTPPAEAPPAKLPPAKLLPEGGRDVRAGQAPPAPRTFAPATPIPLKRAEPSAAGEPAPTESAAAAPAPAAPPEPPPVDHALVRLEEFLAAILRARDELEIPGPPGAPDPRR